MPVDSFEPMSHPEVSDIYRDSLTDLLNRRWLDENLPKLLEQYPGEIGLLFLDLDGLKEANDVDGHQEGDRLLKNTADTIHQSLRQGDEERPGDEVSHVALRLAGDEFVIIITGLHDQSDLGSVVSRVENNLEANGVRASIDGLLHTNETLTELLEKADALMYAKKIQRKLEQLTPRQREAILKIGQIATEAEISLRDVPAVLPILRQEGDS